MANELIIKIKGDASDFKKAVDKSISDAKKSFKGIGDELGKELRRVETVGTTAFKGIGGIIAGLVTGAGTLLQKGNQYNMEIEQGINSLSILLGDTQKAQAMFEELREYDKISPFDLNQLIASSKEMMAYGIETEKVIPMMKMFGDIAMGDQDKMSHLALAFAQCSAAGKLMGQDLNQMINAGFNPLEYIAKRTGKTVGELREEMSKGAISVDMVTQAFKDATSEGGRFYNATEIGSQTIQGKMSIMQADFEAFLGEVSREFTNVFGGKIVPQLSDYLDQIMDAFHEKGFDGLIDIAGNILADMLTRIAETLPDVIRTGATVAKSLIEGLHSNIPQLLETARLLIDTLLENIRSIMPDILAIGKDIIGTILEGFIQYKVLIMEMGVQIITTLAQGLAESAPTLAPKIAELLVYLINLFAENVPQLLQSLITIISELAKAIMDNLPQILAGIGQLIYSLINTFFDNLPQILEAAVQIVGAVLALVADVIVVALIAIWQNIKGWWDNTVKPKLDFAGKVVKECFNLMKQEVSQKVDEIKTKVGQTVENIKSTISEKVNTIKNNITTKVSEIKSGITTKCTEIVTSITTKIGELPGKMLSIGSNIVQGIWNGIGNAKQWLMDKISGWVGDITGWFKGLLGISSPSKGFAQYGGFMTEGIGVGMEKEMPGLKNIAISQLRQLQTVYDNFSLKAPELAISAPRFNALSGGGSTSVVTNENGNTFNFNNYIGNGSGEDVANEIFQQFQWKIRQFGGL